MNKPQLPVRRPNPHPYGIFDCNYMYKISFYSWPDCFTSHSVQLDFRRDSPGDERWEPQIKRAAFHLSRARPTTRNNRRTQMVFGRCLHGIFRFVSRNKISKPIVTKKFKPSFSKLFSCKNTRRTFQKPERVRACPADYNAYVKFENAR